MRQSQEIPHEKRVVRIPAWACRAVGMIPETGEVRLEFSARCGPLAAAIARYFDEEADLGLLVDETGVVWYDEVEAHATGATLRLLLALQADNWQSDRADLLHRLRQRPESFRKYLSRLNGWFLENNLPLSAETSGQKVFLAKT